MLLFTKVSTTFHGLFLSLFAGLAILQDYNRPFTTVNFADFLCITLP
uniref:Uncharacterized protein n=1 Tax=virus sp. ctmTa7 TaxID=2828255 RepID=A0A8S5RCQ4_9VIRU|nr:MAG TPA: hypothetical protein [virus sp. ctmTa7]